MQKPLCWLFSLSTLMVNVVVAQTADQVCQIEVIGHNAPMTVSVGIKNGQIRWIDSAKNMETDNVGRVALKTVADRILATQSLNVDIVSGATFSSLALKKSVTDCLKQSGFDPIDWKKAKITNTDPLHY